jgi:hypothetical protein
LSANCCAFPPKASFSCCSFDFNVSKVPECRLPSVPPAPSLQHSGLELHIRGHHGIRNCLERIEKLMDRACRTVVPSKSVLVPAASGRPHRCPAPLPRQSQSTSGEVNVTAVALGAGVGACFAGGAGSSSKATCFSASRNPCFSVIMLPLRIKLPGNAHNPATELESYKSCAKDSPVWAGAASK